MKQNQKGKLLNGQERAQALHPSFQDFAVTSQSHTQSESQDEKQQQEGGKMSWGQWLAQELKEARRFSFRVVKFLCFLHVTNNHLCTPAMLYGPSMLPTVNLIGDLVLAERISPRLGKVAPGDIVLVRSPVNPRSCVTKRLIGVEGDRVTFAVDPENSDKCETIVVPKGHIWIEGDNPYNSRDSRQYGAVPYGLLEAKVFWRFWPPKDFGPLGSKAL